MKGSLRRALALLVAIMMVSTCMPLTALAEIIEASGSVQPFRVIQPDQGVYVTFEFYNGDEKVDTQIVTNGDTLYAPASPEKEGYKFTGWMKEGGEAFGGFGVVEGYAESQTIRLDAGFEQVYYVFFLDQNGTVCVTKEGLSGASISTTDVTFPTATDEGIAGWYYDADKKVPAGSAVTLEDANIILYPDVQQGHWLTFDTAGGSYLDPVFVAPGAVTQTPDTPTRLGFDFLGWYNGEQPFSFGQELTASVELTAKWQGHQVDYKVLYWLENADDDGYSLDKMDTLHGIAGEMTEAGSNYNPGEGFHLSADHSLVQQTIAGDGSTLVNVYYDRDVYTIYFYQSNSSAALICGKEAHTHNRWCYDWWDNLTCGKEEHTHTAACYAPNPSAYAADPIVAKYGAYIGDQWPSNNESGNNWSTQNNGSDPYQANIQTMPLGGTTFYVPDNGGNRRFSATYYAEVLDGERGTVSHDGRMYNVHHTDVIYANSSSLYVSEEDRYPLVGFTFVDGTALNANYNRAVFYYTRNDYTLTRINQGTTDAHTVQYEADISGYGAVPERPAGIPENYAFQGWYLDEEFQEAYDFSGKVMPAQNVTVYAKWAAPEVDATVYLTMAGDGEPQVQAIPYGTKIDEEWLESLQVTAPEGYTWHGWATKNGDVYTPFNLDTIITQDVTLYPYYTSNASFTVAYDANGGEGTVADAKKYADRAYADVQSYAGLTAPQGKVFLGWNTAADGSGEMYQPGDKLLVAAENANEGNVVTLYAQWGGQAGTVELTYHANFTEAVTATKEETQLINNGVITVSGYEATGLSERAGYEFTGWNTAADGTGTAFAAGQNVRVNDKSAAEANHLYAQWEKKVATYTVQHYIQVLDAEDKLQYELADEESFTVDVGTSVNDELINALKKSNLKDADDGIGSPAYADGLYHYVYERNEAELAVDGQITSDADVIKLYYQRELTRTVFDDGVVSAEDAYEDDPNEIRQGVITVETHYVGGSKDGTVNTDKVYFKFNKSEMVDLKIAVNSDEYILNTITADLRGGNGWDGTVLDNVLGNSTVRIYLTPKYTLEYYKVENGEETRVYADVETKTYTLAPETTGTQAFVQTEYPTSATLQPLPEEEGYTWSGWYQDAGLTGDTLPENSVQKINDLVEDTTEKVIKLYTGNKTANEYPYTIHHYLYGTTVKVAEDTTGTDAFGTNVMVTPATEFLAGFEDAQAKTIPGKITIKVDGNEATVYYTVPLTLTADGASKTYDGDPLTCGTFTADGLVNGDEVTDFALSMTAESTITNVGTQSNVIDEATVTYKGEAIPSYYTVTYEPGTLTITAVSDGVVVTITEHSATETYDGTEKSVTGYTVTDISNELYKATDFSFNGTAEAKGTEEGFYPMEVKAEDFTNNNENFSNVKFVIVDGGLTINASAEEVVVTITEHSATETYDGTEKSVTGYTVTDISNELYKATDFSFNGTAEAKGTEEGFYPMEVKAEDFTNDNPNFSNVKFVIVDGGLTINASAEEVVVTITEHSATETYDGTEKSVTGYTVTDISNELYTEDDFTFNGTAEAKGTNEGFYPMEVKAEDFTNDNPNFSNVKFVIVDGGLTINASAEEVVVTITEHSATETYDGTEKSVTGYTVTDISNELYTEDDFTFNGTAEAKGTEVGFYPMEVKAEDFTNDNPNFSNVKFVIVDGGLTINASAEEVVVTITEHSATETYDGTEKSVTGYTVTDISNELYTEDDFTFNGTAEAKGTNEGFYPMEVKAEDFTNDNPNFSNVKFVIVDGGLTINASAEEVVVTITEHSATETYDGTEKSVTGYTVTDISNELYTEDDFTFNGTAEAKGTEEGFYPMEVKAEDFTNNNENFSNVKFVIVDGGLTIEKRPVMVTVNNETYKYDGYLKTVADDNGQEYTVEGESEGRGLLNGDDISLNVVYGVYADEAQSLVGQYTADAKDGSIVISNANGDVTKNYAVTVVPGWLVITDGTEDDPVNPDAVLTKTHLAGVYDLGDVTFTITVKNIYNEAKTITIREQPGVELIGADEEGKIVYQDVPAGEQVTAYAKYTITEADILEGTFTNHVTAEFSDAKTYTNEDTVDIADLDTTLTVVKSSGVPEGGTASLGETINYTITVTNDGNVSYTGVKVVDDLAGLKINEDTRYTVNEDGTVTVGDLAVGETVVITASYVVTSDDIKAGHVLNTVTATGDSIDDPKNPDKPKTPEGEDEEDDETDDLDTTLTVTKSSDVAEGATVGLGETINYTITVKNDGNVPYTGVKVVDDLAGLQIHEDARYTVEEDGTVTVGDLAVGETVTITASYIVTSDDIKAGHVLNAVTAAGDPIEDPKNPDEPKKPEGEDEEDDETDDLDTTLTVVKTSDVAEGEVAKEGQTIHYTITVTNEGNVPYTDVTVIDDMEGLVIDANDRYTVQEDGTVTVGGLAVGETVTITASYTVTADDILVGTVVNAATVSGDDVEDPKNPDEPKTPEGGDETEVTLAVDVPVTVHWVDGDQFYRPTAALTVQLIGNDGVVMDEVVVDPTTMGTDWTYTFENMPTHDENGDLIVYSVLEPVAPGNGRYDVTYNGLEVTNTAYVTVTFVDWNGAVLQNERILVGATGTVPESPRRVGYNFTQWSGGSWENVTRDQIIHANYMTVYEAIDELNIPLAGGTIQNVGDCFD